MKLIITGASGYVGSEIIRQCLQSPQVTSVVAVSRKPIPAPDSSVSARLKSVVVENYGNYTEDVKTAFEGASACIWTVGITPMTYKSLDPEQARKVCLDDTIAGLKSIVGSTKIQPFRFLYMSGADAERDQTKTPKFMPEYFLMRGEVENQVLNFAEQHPSKVEACIARPGWIINDSTDLRDVQSGVHHDVPTIKVESVAAALVQQAVNGFAKETLWTDDLKSIAEDK